VDNLPSNNFHHFTLEVASALCCTNCDIFRGVYLGYLSHFTESC
jgi:hypothetical protein